MIQHTRVFIYLFIYLFIYSSCNYKKQLDNVKSTESLSEKIKIGKWELVKSAKWDLWEEDHYSKEELNKIYRNYTIVFKKDDLLIFSGKESYPLCEGDEIIIKETLDFHINGTDEDRKNVKAFFEKEFGLLEKDFRGRYSLNCKYPFHKILDFGDKLLVREYGAYYYLFEKQKDIEEDTLKIQGYDCKEIEIKTSIYEEPLYKICECDYSFSKCYSFLYEDSYYQDKLLQDLPKEDTVISFGGIKETQYKYYKKDSLIISIVEESGGGMEYLFKKNKGKTIIEFYADLP